MIKQIYKDKFIKNNAIFFIGTMVISVFTYLYHPVLSRMMEVEAFGEVQALISLLALFGVVLGVYKVQVVNIVSNTENIQEKQEIISRLKKSGLVLTVVIVLLIIVLSNTLKEFLNFSSIYPFISLAVLMAIGLFSNFRRAILQGWHDFKSVSVAGIILALGRLIFAALLVYLGWSAFGAITGIVIAEVLSLIYVFNKTKKEFPMPFRQKIKTNRSLKKELKYGLLVLFITLCVTFLFSADVIIVKHYYPPEEAGLYSGIATIARIIFFVTGSVAGVLLPSVKINDIKKENRKILSKAILILLGLGGLALLAFAVFPEAAIKILIGERYLVYASLLPKLSLFLFILSIVNLIFSYYLALRKYFLLFIAVISPLVVIVLSYFRHNSLSQIINNFLLVSILMLIYLFFQLLLPYFNKPKALNT